MFTTGKVERLLAFEPEGLRAARAEVLDRHPGTVDNPVALSEDRLAELREKILACKGSDDRLRELGSRLRSRELRGCLTGLEIWDDLRPAIAKLLRGHESARWLPRVWKSWQRYPEVPEIDSLLWNLGRSFGWERVTGPAYQTVAPDWVAARPSALRIVQWLDGKGLSYSNLASLAELPLSADTPLYRGVRDAVMTDGSRAQLMAEGVSRLLGWYAELSPQDRQRFHRNYLAKIRSGDWNLKLVESIRSEYGLPRTPKRPAFWDEVPQEVRDEFQAFFIEKKLAEVFAGDTERHDYWRRWMSRMTDVHTGIAGHVDYAILEFGRFGVVEFFETGNAAYFYRWDDLVKVKRLNPRNPADLKVRFDDPFVRWKDNRILHQAGWEEKADQKLETWLRRARR